MKTHANTTASRAYLIIGSGRLSRHLQHYFNMLRIQFLTWNRKQSLEELNKHFELKPVILLAISDQAILPFFESHLKGRNLTVVHFSGALHLTGLISCHPLMTFSNEVYPLESYKAVHFAVTGTKSLQDIFPDLPNSSFHLDESHKALYHAWCVLSAAGAQTLWKSALNNLKNIGVSEEAFSPYIKQISHNFVLDPQNSLTGPWVRKDQSTIDKNLKALTTPEAQKVYELLMKGNL